MNDQEIVKNLEQSFNEAIDAINCFNKEMKGAIEALKDYVGVAK